MQRSHPGAAGTLLLEPNQSLCQKEMAARETSYERQMNPSMSSRLRGRERQPKPLGWNGHEAEWITFVYLHEGLTRSGDPIMDISSQKLLSPSGLPLQKDRHGHFRLRRSRT